MDLQAHSLALHICSELLQEAPDGCFLAGVREQGLFSVWPLTPRTGEAAAALGDLNREYGEGESDVEAAAAALRLDHLTLFSGPVPAARPWESVWREKDELLFGEQTVRVRERYAAWGLTVENAGHVPEDHIALELAFCVHLLHRMASVESEAADAALTAFLDEHLLQWAGPCLRKASEAATQALYRCLPLLCLDALHALREGLSRFRALRQ